MTKLSIIGSLPVDGSSLSVAEKEVRSWLGDAVSYPGEWRDPGFEVIQEDVPKGAVISVELKDTLTDEQSEVLAQRINLAQFVIMHYANLAGTKMGLLAPLIPSIARKKREWMARFDGFDHAVRPVRAALVNGLASFHQKVAPIARVRLGFPA